MNSTLSPNFPLAFDSADENRSGLTSARQASSRRLVSSLATRHSPLPFPILVPVTPGGSLRSNPMKTHSQIFFLVVTHLPAARTTDLFRAGIHPRRKSSRTGPYQLRCLTRASFGMFGVSNFGVRRGTPRATGFWVLHHSVLRAAGLRLCLAGPARAWA
jgi:hypothetical protein